MRLQSNYYPFDLFTRSNAIYMSNYQPTKTPIIQTSENLYQDVIDQRASAILTNSLPNSISKATYAADVGRRLNVIG